jgi:hypothetical protein
MPCGWPPHEEGSSVRHHPPGRCGLPCTTQSWASAPLLPPVLVLRTSGARVDSEVFSRAAHFAAHLPQASLALAIPGPKTQQQLEAIARRAARLLGKARELADSLAEVSEGPGRDAGREGGPGQSQSVNQAVPQGLRQGMYGWDMNFGSFVSQPSALKNTCKPLEKF